MQPPSDQPGKNRRLQRRRSAKGGARVVCRANAMGLGPNVAKSLLDLSEAGAHVEVTVGMMKHQEVELELCSVSLLRPIKTLAEVIWCVPYAENLFHVGLRFRRLLTFQDLQALGR